MSRAICRFVLMSALIVSVARSSPAAGPVGGPAFGLTTCANCNKTNPGLAGASNGKLVATFDVKVLGQTSFVQGRVFTPTGAGRPAFRPQTNALPPQYDAVIASNTTGAFVFAWSTADPLTRNSEIWAQRYSAVGLKSGPAIAVTVDTPGVRVLDARPAVAMGADGGFAVAWIRVVPPGEPNPTRAQVWARRFSPAGSPLAAPILVSGTVLVDGTRPSACMDTLGRTVIVWATDDELKPFEPSLIGVSMRRMTAKGAPLARVVVVAQPKSAESHPAVSCGLASSFVVAWETDQPPTTGVVNVVAQRYSASAAKVGAVFTASPSLDRQRVPVIATDAGGNFVIVWQTAFSPTTGIYGQRFSSTAVRLGPQFTVALAESAVTPLSAPAVAVTGSANAFAVAWANPKTGLFGRRFKIVP